MSSDQNNPNLHHDTTIYAIGKGVSWLVALVFMLMLLVPPLYEHVKPRDVEEIGKAPLVELFTTKGANEKLIDHLHRVEGKLDDSSYSANLRMGVQQYLTTRFGQGTRKVFIGHEGWLFYQPDLRALTGFGPLKPEPFSVMKDPELAKLPHTRDVLLNFTKQLEERGVKLLLVPLPLKPMIYPEYVAPSIQREWITHPDAPAYYEELREAGLDVLDLTEPLAKIRSKRRYVYVREPDPRDKEAVQQAILDAKEMKETFLKQDTHWTPEAMRDAAELVANHIKQRYADVVQPAEQVIRARDGVYRKSMGDLVELVDLKQPEEVFAEESAFLRVISENTQDANSSISLLGDSFINIFDDPSLGFDDAEVADQGEPRIRAGFAQHLSLYLQQPLDVIALNGGGATAVRREFARKFDDEVRAKKLVVWVIASRDLLLSRTAAHHANIHWDHVQFNPAKKPVVASQAPEAGTVASQAVVVEAVLTEKSPNQDPIGTPYTEALHIAAYDVEKVLEGVLEVEQVAGVQWTFRNKQMQPTANFAEGNRYRLTLVPWDSKSELRGLNIEDTTSAFDAPRWFVEKAEPIE